MLKVYQQLYTFQPTVKLNNKGPVEYLGLYKM